MRTIEIKGGPIEMRINAEQTDVCFVFTSHDADVRLFRTMTLAEARGFCLRLDEQLKGVEL